MNPIAFAFTMIGCILSIIGATTGINCFFIIAVLFGVASVVIAVIDIVRYDKKQKRKK